MKEPSLLDVVAAGGGLSGSALNPQLLWNADSAKGLRERVSGKLGVPVWFFPDGEHELGGCAAGGRAILHINAAGAVEPCPFIHEPGESLNEHSLTDILCSPSLASVRTSAQRGRDEPCALLCASDNRAECEQRR